MELDVRAGCGRGRGLKGVCLQWFEVFVSLGVWFESVGVIDVAGDVREICVCWRCERLNGGCCCSVCILC